MLDALQWYWQQLPSRNVSMLHEHTYVTWHLSPSQMTLSSEDSTRRMQCETKFLRRFFNLLATSAPSHQSNMTKGDREAHHIYLEISASNEKNAHVDVANCVSFSKKIKILEEILGATRRVRGPQRVWSVKTTGKYQYPFWKINTFYRYLNLMTPTLPTSRWKRGRNRWCFSLLSEPFDWSLGHLIEEWPRWNIWSVIII